MNDIAGLALLVGCKATLILGLVAGLLALAGRRWPQNCLVWQRVGVTALLVLPLAAGALPTLGIPVFSSPAPIAAGEAAPIFLESASPPPSLTDSEPTNLPILPARPAAPASAAPVLQESPSTGISMPGLTLTAYGLVALALVVRLVRAWRGLERLKRASSPLVEPAWQATLKHWCTVLRVGDSVELRSSAAADVPMTFYWRSPVILIPGDCVATCDQSQRDAIVVHELTHVAGRDFLWQALSRLAATLYWLHPLVWLVRRQDAALCERICDACCSQYLGRESYGLALVRIAGRKILGPAATLGLPMAHAASLQRRLNDLRTGALSPQALLTRTRRLLFGGAAALVLGLIVVGSLTARASAARQLDEQSPAPATAAPPAAAPSQANPTDNPPPAAPQGHSGDAQGKPTAGGKAKVSIYEKKLAVAAADVKIAELEFKYTRQLVEDKVIGRGELSLAEARLDSANAQAGFARAILDFATAGAATGGGVPGALDEKKAAAVAAAAKIAELQYKYTRELFEKKVVSKDEVSLAEAKRDSAKAQAELQAELDVATVTATTEDHLPAAVYARKAAAAVAEAKIAELEYNYTRRLVEDKVVSQNELSLIEAKRDKAQAKAELAKAELDFAGGAAPAEYHLPPLLKGQVLDQHDKPVAGADVKVTLMRGDAHGQLTATGAPPTWHVTTDEQGRYQFETGSPSLGPHDPLYIKIRAKGFPDVSRGLSYPPESAGDLPVERLPAGRTVTGRLVDPQGSPVADAIVRFQASSVTDLLWDSGPLPVDTRGMFSVVIPADDKAAMSIYPRTFAPQVVKIPPEESDLGSIHLETGTALAGRVVDREGRGVAGTVVALRTQVLDYLRVGIPLGTAVTTDEDGRFRLPPVRGTYHVWVTNGAPDYSRQRYVRGAAPPPIPPQRIDLNGQDETREITLRGAGSLTIRGTVRRADGSGLPDVEIRAETLPPGWQEGTRLASVRTDKRGHYALRLPAPAEGVILSIDQTVEAPDHTFQRIVPVGQGVNARILKFDKLTADVKDADWVVGLKE